MSKVSEYRQHPKECRVLAHRSRSSQHRDMLLDMAATWESLPDEPAHSAAAGRHLVDARPAQRPQTTSFNTAPVESHAASTWTRAAPCSVGDSAT